MNTTQVAVDLAKSVFQVAVSSTPGRVDEQQRMSRARFRRFFAGHRPVEVLMEACGTAHHWGRELEALGHTVSLLPPAGVRRYRDGDKTDRADTKALLECGPQLSNRLGPVKTIDQQAIPALHRLRSSYLQTRTARINCIRGLLRAFGVTIPVGARHLVVRAREAIEGGAVPHYLEHVLLDAITEVEELRRKAADIERQLKRLAPHMPDATLLMSVPGIGVLTATALVAYVGDVRRFRSGRHFAAYLGLTPREHSSGLSRRLGRISKRGNSIPPHAAHPRSAVGSACLGTRSRVSKRAQHRCDRVGQQARAHHLACLARTSGLRTTTRYLTTTFKRRAATRRQDGSPV